MGQLVTHNPRDPSIVDPNVYPHTEASIERVQTLADISRSALYAFAVYKAISLHTCVVIATKPVHRLHRLQIHLTVHKYRAPPTIPPSYIPVHAVV